MCYAKPGPRCSSHARQELREAKANYDAALMGNASDIELNMYRQARDNALQDYRRTPEGIRKLRDVGMNDLADAYEAERQQMVQRYRASQASRADQEQWNPIEDIQPGTMVVHNGKVRVVESVRTSDDVVNPQYDVAFTDGINARYMSGSQPVLLATPDGKVPLMTRNPAHQMAYSAAVAKMGGTPPSGDKVIVYAKNSQGNEFVACVNGPRARGKYSRATAKMLAEQMNEQLGENVSISVMSTDPALTRQKSSSVSAFMQSIYDDCEGDSVQAESFHDNYAR